MAQTQEPIVIKHSAAGDQATAGIRLLIVLLGGLSSVLGFLSRHDISGLVVYLQSNAALPAIGAAGVVGAFLWGQWKAIRAKRDSVRLGNAVPNEVAIVVGGPDKRQAPKRK